MMAGSDFIKTSTGKETLNATIPFGIVMCRAIRDYYQRTGYRVSILNKYYENKHLNRSTQNILYGKYKEISEEQHRECSNTNRKTGGYKTINPNMVFKRY